MIYVFYLFALFIIICMFIGLFGLLYEYRKRIDIAIDYINRMYLGNKFDEKRLINILEGKDNE